MQKLHISPNMELYGSLFGTESTAISRRFFKNFVVKCKKMSGLARVFVSTARNAEVAAQSHKTFLLIFVMMFMTNCIKAGGPVLSFDGGSVSEAEIAEKNKMELHELREQEYQLKRQAAYQMAQEKILELEAKKAGLSVEQLLKRETDKRKQAPLTEEQLKSFYERNKNQIRQPYVLIKDQLRAELESRGEDEIRGSYIREVFQSYNVKFNLDKPKAPKLDIDIAGKPFWGKADAKVVIVEFSDYECPYCKNMQPDVQRIKAEYSDKIKWVFRNFPLDFHRQAIKAHTGANCAGRQNKYFEYQARLFAAPSRKSGGIDLGEPTLRKIAVDIGLDTANFNVCLADKAGVERKIIQEDLEYGKKVGVRGTPTIFFNGQYLSGMRNYESLKEMIEEALK